MDRKKVPQKSPLLAKDDLEWEKENRMLVKLLLSIMWIVYLPVAFMVFIFSPMAFGSTNDSEMGKATAGWLLMNGVPLLIMIALTIFVIKVKNKIYAVAAIAALIALIALVGPLKFFEWVVLQIPGAIVEAMVAFNWLH